MNKTFSHIFFFSIIFLFCASVFAQKPPTEKNVALKGFVNPDGPGYFMIQLNENTFVTGKDLGKSQLIMVFKVSQQGQLVLTQKAKFFY